MAVFGVEREEAILQPQSFHQLGRGGDFVALLGDHHMREHDEVAMAQRRHHVCGLAVVEGVEAAAQSLPIHGDRRQPLDGLRRRQACAVTSKGRLQRLWIDAAQDQAQASVRRRIGHLEVEAVLRRWR